MGSRLYKLVLWPSSNTMYDSELHRAPAPLVVSSLRLVVVAVLLLLLLPMLLFYRFCYAAVVVVVAAVSSILMGEHRCCSRSVRRCRRTAAPRWW